MLYIFMGIFVLIFVIGIILLCDVYGGENLITIGGFGSVVFLIAWMITIGCYNNLINYHS